jgi:hypothetical protein
VLVGFSAFIFSTAVITIFGEIAPQAYFSRNALLVTSTLSPVFRLYRLLLYPVAKPLAIALDRVLGPEGIVFFRERQMRHLIRKHIEASEAEIDRIEGLGALNFLEIDDVPVVQEGGPLNPDSVISIAFDGEKPVFPSFSAGSADPFLRAVQQSGEKWIVFTDEQGCPRLVLDADGFLREAMFAAVPPDPSAFCHRPIVVTDPNEKLGLVLTRWNVEPSYSGDNVIDHDLVLLWGELRRVITGADILGRLLSGIAGTGASAAATP